MKQQKFSIKKRIKSFSHAFNGLRILIKEEHNARIHFLALIAVVVAGFFFKISLPEWISITVVSCIVISAEIFNSSIENIADFISPQKHAQIKKIKDLSAAAVLVAAIAALITGLLIFLPKILEY
jgi:undecaprenol kinase/diacylglycerol kinase (ATP)